MTPEERARKILGIVRNPETLHESQIEMAAAQIEEACRSAEQDGNIEGYKKGHDIGFAAARDKAVEIAKEWPGPGGIIQVNDVLSTNDCMNGLRQGIAARIAEMKP